MFKIKVYTLQVGARSLSKLGRIGEKVAQNVAQLPFNRSLDRVNAIHAQLTPNHFPHDAGEFAGRGGGGGVDVAADSPRKRASSAALLALFSGLSGSVANSDAIRSPSAVLPLGYSLITCSIRIFSSCVETLPEAGKITPHRRWRGRGGGGDGEIPEDRGEEIKTRQRANAECAGSGALTRRRSELLEAAREATGGR